MATVIFLEDAVEGMTLSDSIVNNQGQTLLPAGIVLAQQHLRILKTWNIRLIHIKEDESEEENSINPELLKLAEENLITRMNWTAQIDIEIDLFNAAKQIVALQLTNKRGADD